MVNDVTIPTEKTTLRSFGEFGDRVRLDLLSHSREIRWLFTLALMIVFLATYLDSLPNLINSKDFMIFPTLTFVSISLFWTSQKSYRFHQAWHCCALYSPRRKFVCFLSFHHTRPIREMVSCEIVVCVIVWAKRPHCCLPSFIPFLRAICTVCLRDVSPFELIR